MLHSALAMYMLGNQCLISLTTYSFDMKPDHIKYLTQCENTDLLWGETKQ